MPLKINCDWCGKTIKRKPSTVKEHNYCSRICLGKANAERFRLKRLKICDYCGSEFEYLGHHKKRNTHFFCSTGCANKYKTKRMTVRCDWCDKKFEKNDLMLIDQTVIFADQNVDKTLSDGQEFVAIVHLLKVFLFIEELWKRL